MKMLALVAVSLVATATIGTAPAAAHGWKWKNVCTMHHHHKVCHRQHVRW
jgi:hypothetical protein